MILEKRGYWKFLVLLASMFLFSIYPTNAQEMGCCEYDGQGSYCLPTTQANCDPNALWTSVSCEQTSFCSVGCCINSIDGSCSENVPQAACENTQNTAFHEGTSCDTISYCQMGCCELGSSFIFNTKQSCQRLIDEYYPSLDIEQSWNDQITDEYTCISQSIQEDEGCCVESDGVFNYCNWGTRGTCSTSGEENSAESSEGFYKDIFCSNSNLECSTCTAHVYTDCGGQNNEDVYWFDSCGNREELVESCDPLGIYGAGSICKNDGNNAACSSVDCEDTSDFLNNVHDPEMGGYRSNGESWCVRQAKVGIGSDLPGSRHYRYSCIYGEELVESCDEFREDICLQFLPNESSGMNFAACVENEGANCVSECNKKPLNEKRNQNEACCEQYDSCSWMSSACVPNVPPGYAFDDRFVQTTPEYSAKDQCKVGNAECESVWVKNWKFQWECKENCHCMNEDWPADMNTFCRSLGDCGAWYNLAGEFTSSGQRTGGSGQTKNLNSKDYQKDYPFSEVINGGDQLTINSELLKHTTAWEMYHFWRVEAIFLWPIWFLEDFDSALTSFLRAAGFGWLFGIGDRKTKTHKFFCSPWQAPLRSDSCEQCSDLAPDGVCYESLCRSLGKNCELINGDDPILAECISGSVNDVVPPHITPSFEIIENQKDQFDVNYQVNIISGGNGFVIDPDVDPLKEFVIGLETNEPAQCRYDFSLDKISYYEMDYEFDEGSALVHEHNLSLVLPGGKDYELYVRCMDFYENGEDAPPYLVKFNTKDEPDNQPAIILATDPWQGSPVAYNVNETPLILYLNEPVETCRWSNQNIPFEQMHLNNSFFCGCDVGELNSCTGTSASGGEDLCEYLDENGLFVYDDFECVGLLEGIQPEQENEFFISCVDIQKDDGTGCNYFSNNYKFSLMGSSELEIISAEPENGTYYTPWFDVRITTLGGADNGNAVCYLDGIEFYETGSNLHIQSQNRSAGSYEYGIECMDVAGNVASIAMEIEIDIDDNAPTVENLYLQGGILYLITDEPSTCEYSIDNPEFSIGNGLELTGRMVKEHSLAFVEDVYYIKCYDSYTNIGETISVYIGA